MNSCQNRKSLIADVAAACGCPAVPSSASGIKRPGFKARMVHGILAAASISVQFIPRAVSSQSGFAITDQFD